MWMPLFPYAGKFLVNEYIVFGVQTKGVSDAAILHY